MNHLQRKANGNGGADNDSSSQSSRNKLLPRKQHLPVPVAIELHNVFPKIRTPRKKWFRPEHSTSLLSVVRIEIVVREETNDQQQQPLHEETTLHSALSDSKRASMFPSWYHLTDYINTPQLSAEAYESMKARFLVVNDNDISASKNTSTSASATAAAAGTLFLEANLHPSMLCRIASLPTSLQPLNFVVVRFSDDSLRVNPAHYQALLESKQMGVVCRGAQDYSESFSKHDVVSRFEDGAFLSLDQVSTSNTASSITSPAEAATASPPPAGEDEVDEDHSSAEHGAQVSLEHSSNNGATANGLEKRIVKQNGVCLLDDIHDEDDEHDSVMLATQHEALLQIIEQEEISLKNESANLRNETIELRQLMEEIRLVEEQTCQVEQVVRTDQVEIQKMSFILEAQRIRLLRELSTIYPITVTVEGERRYLIRGLEIPLELFASALPEDVVSAALGFLCHTVALMSKYLGVHLRYRLYCQSSRSAVQDERGATFPLFGRPADREQVIYGAHLLDMDIECIAKARGVRLSPKLHMLAKVKRIYEHTIDGY